jgi:hypothetical protein
VVSGAARVLSATSGGEHRCEDDIHWKVKFMWARGKWLRVTLWKIHMYLHILVSW